MGTTLLLPFLPLLAPVPSAVVSEVRVADLDETVILRADGTAEYAYRGRWNWDVPDERVGVYRAKLDPREFRRLAALPGVVHFGEMKDFYLPYSTSIVRTTVVRDGKAKTLERNDRPVATDPEPPADLWTLELAARGLAARLKWEPIASGVRVRAGGEGKGVRWVMVRETGTNFPVASVRTEKAEVQVPLRPGSYRVEVSVLRRGKWEDVWSRDAAVKSDAYTPVAER